ncbi:MAG: three-Cys-motif partner protein TcmP [Crenarchaeota archaeon]|jgi:three-Cys-motif partner protein|nr:three-Cys-motif partner protein TcmP [Thermoproteota archaeon]
MAKDINSEAFSEETKLKLSIFGECFKEWFPVFLYSQHIDKIFIYDLFAGSGKDSDGASGSPLILLQEISKYCKQTDMNDKPTILLGFNEKKKKKFNLLKENIEKEFIFCKKTCPHEICVIKCSIGNKDFGELINSQRFSDVLKNKKFGKFILLDQYGFKEITDDVFLKLVESPITDFIFFISSSFIRRFQYQPSVRAYFKQECIKFDPNKPKECHREIANYFKALIPRGKEYYVHNFTIKKGANYYGLIFGSNHSYGMEKFLNVCWKIDPLAGESNCNIENDFEMGTLFYDPSETNKIQTVKNKIEKEILEGSIKDNLTGLKYALKEGCKPKLFVDVVRKLLELKKIEIDGKFNQTATNIHKANKYYISVL